MRAEDRSVDGLVTWRHDWAPHLFSIRTTRPAGLAFVPGQFVRLGVPGSDGAMVWRAYSIASAPSVDHFEFYSIVVPDGPFTQPLSHYRVGDAIRIAPMVYGFLRADRFESGRHLWLLATGTGIAPFLSMLADAAIWQHYEHIVVVHSVRRPQELAYRDDFEAWATRPPFRGAVLLYLPTLTAEGGSVDGMLDARITTLIADGRLERQTGLALDPADSRLMICGNPSMIKDTRVLLGARGMTPVRRETPGQYITENFW